MLYRPGGKWSVHHQDYRHTYTTAEHSPKSNPDIHSPGFHPSTLWDPSMHYPKAEVENHMYSYVQDIITRCFIYTLKEEQKKQFPNQTFINPSTPAPSHLLVPHLSITNKTQWYLTLKSRTQELSMSTSRRAAVPPSIPKTRSNTTTSRISTQYTPPPPPSYSSSSQAYKQNSPLSQSQSQSHNSPNEEDQQQSPILSRSPNESHAYSHHHQHQHQRHSSRFSILTIPSSLLLLLSTKSLSLRDNLRDMRNMKNITNLKYRQRRRLYKFVSILFFSCLMLWSLDHYFCYGSSSVVSLTSLFSFSASGSSKEGGNSNPSNGEEGEEEVDYEVITRSSSPPRGGSMRKLTDEILNNLFLDAETCRATFPGLMKEIDDTVAKGPFKVKRSSDLGPMQVRIRDGKIYVVHAQRKRDLSREMVNVCFSAFLVLFYII